MLNNSAYRILQRVGNFNSLAVNYQNNPYKIKKADINWYSIHDNSAKSEDILMIFSSGKVLDTRLSLKVVNNNRDSV